MGFSISNFDDAPIKLKALQIYNVFGEEREVSSAIKRHHQEDLKKNILKFLGSSTLLGNPVSFVESLGTGVDEFFYYPREGFV